jgi:hypothetical protein
VRLEANPRHGEPGGGGPAADQARGGDSAAGRPAAEQAPPRGTAACTVTPRVRARARLRPPRPARRAAAHRARSASGLPPRQPARGCWAGAGAGAAPCSRGLLVPCARSAAGRPAAPSPSLAWCCAAAAGFAIARVASVVPRGQEGHAGQVMRPDLPKSPPKNLVLVFSDTSQ